jgi:transposase
MDLVVERAAGLDVHTATVVATAHTPAGRETRTSGTVTADLQRLAAWLRARGVTHVALEATGVSWQPVWNVLEAAEAGFALLLVNARHVKATPRDCSHRQHSLSRCNGGGHGSDPSAVRLAPAAG